MRELIAHVVLEPRVVRSAIDDGARVSAVRAVRAMAGVAFGALAGCNVIFGLEPGTGGDDATVDARADAAPIDAPWRFGPWGNAATVLADPALNEDDGILSADGKELIFSASATAVPVKDLRVSIRVNDAWNPPVPLDPLNSPVTDGTARFGAGELAIYFGSDRPGGQGGADVWRAGRDGAGGAWREPVVVVELSSPGDERTPSPCLGDARFILFSTRNGPGQLIELDPARSATVIDVGTLAPVSPFVTADCLMLYFAGLVPGGTDFDLYVMQRAALDTSWSMPQRIDELATPMNESDPWLSADGRHLLFSRDSAGASDIWEAFRDPV